jgi:hypothetical protein
MKNLFVMAIAVMLVTACQQEKQRYFSESPEIETVKAGIKAYEAQDWESWNAHLADTAKFYPNTTKGISATEYLENTKAMVSTLSSYGFDSNNTFLEMVIDNDEETWVNYWSTWKGTLAANGKELTIPVHLTIQFVNGKIVEEYGYWDMSSYYAALQEIEEVNKMSADHKAIMKTINKIVEGWNAHKIDNLKSVSVQNLVRTTNGVVQVKNINDYEEMMKALVSAFPDLKVRLDKAVINNNKIYINWTVTGTNNGVFAGNPATSKKVKVHGFSVWTFNKDGKAIQEDAFFDNLTMFNQLGLTPPKS